MPDFEASAGLVTAAAECGSVSGQSSDAEESKHDAHVPGLRLRPAVAAQRAAHAAAERHRGAAEGAGRRRLPQRSASRRRLFRSRRRQAHEPCRPRHEAAGDARPRERRRGGGGRAGRARASRSATRVLAHPWIGCGDLRGLPARRRKSLPRHAQPRRVLQRRLCRLSDGAASALSVRHRRPAAGARGAARLFGRHHLRRAEEGRRR